MSSDLTTNNNRNQLIFEHSVAGRLNGTQMVANVTATPEIPENLLRKTPPMLPEVSEMDAVRHYTRLSQKNFSIDTQFYPLGSCTMKACAFARFPGQAPIGSRAIWSGGNGLFVGPTGNTKRRDGYDSRVALANGRSPG